jgi:hypothetical protein
MSDDDLRTLERRFKETGAPDDEARYRVARIRAGEVVRLAWDLSGDSYGVRGRTLVDSIRPLAAALAPGFDPPAQERSREVGGLEDRGMGEWSFTTTTLLGDAQRGFEVVDVSAGISDGMTPGWSSVTIRAYGLPDGTTLEASVGLMSPAYGRPNVVHLRATGDAERIAALAALAHERHQAREEAP